MSQHERYVKVIVLCTDTYIKRQLGYWNFFLTFYEVRVYYLNKARAAGSCDIKRAFVGGDSEVIPFRWPGGGVVGQVHLLGAVRGTARWSCELVSAPAYCINFEINYFKY